MHTPGIPRIYKGHVIPREENKTELPKAQDPNAAGTYPQQEVSPYQFEWDDLMDAIRNDKPYNEARRGGRPRCFHGPDGRSHGPDRHC